MAGKGNSKYNGPESLEGNFSDACLLEGLCDWPKVRRGGQKGESVRVGAGGSLALREVATLECFGQRDE